MKPTSEQTHEALKAFEREFKDRWSGYTFNYEKAQAQLEQVREFNRNWDQELSFYVEVVEDWMNAVPAVWTRRTPSPHPVFGHWKDDWNYFLAEQRRISGQEAAFLTNSIRCEKKYDQQIVVSRMWLLTALFYEGKVGSEGFWETVLDEVVRELPDWTVDDGGDRKPPEVKTLRNMIDIRLHKRFFEKIAGVEISRDG